MTSARKPTYDWHVVLILSSWSNCIWLVLSTPTCFHHPKTSRNSLWKCTVQATFPIGHCNMLQGSHVGHSTLVGETDDICSSIPPDLLENCILRFRMIKGAKCHANDSNFGRLLYQGASVLQHPPLDVGFLCRKLNTFHLGISNEVRLVSYPTIYNDVCTSPKRFSQFSSHQKYIL